MITTIFKNFFTIKPKRDLSISNRRAALAVIAIFLTQLGDFASTAYGLSHNATEANGLMADFINERGILAFLSLKIIASIFLGYTTYKRKIAPWIIAGLYALVIIWNLIIISIH